MALPDGNKHSVAAKFRGPEQNLRASRQFRPEGMGKRYSGVTGIFRLE